MNFYACKRICVQYYSLYNEIFIFLCFYEPRIKLEITSSYYYKLKKKLKKFVLNLKMGTIIREREIYLFRTL